MDTSDLATQMEKIFGKLACTKIGTKSICNVIEKWEERLSDSSPAMSIPLEEESMENDNQWQQFQAIYTKLIQFVGNSIFRSRLNFQGELQNIFNCLNSSLEQLQLHLEYEKKISDTTAKQLAKQMLSTLSALTEMNVSTTKNSFQRDWSISILSVLCRVAHILQDNDLEIRFNERIIAALEEEFTDKSAERKALSFALHNLAICYRRKSAYEESLKYYQVAFKLCNKVKDWKSDKSHHIFSTELQKGAQKSERLRRREDITEATIGNEGGRLSINYCDVQIPPGATDETKTFTVESLARVPHQEFEKPLISNALVCMPPTKFKSPVKIKIPTFCSIEDDDISIEVVCFDSDMKEIDILKSEKLCRIGSDILFETMHFSVFTIILDKLKAINSKGIRYKMGVAVWTTNDGNYAFIAYVKNKVIEEKWKKEFAELGYHPTPAYFNPMAVHNLDEIAVTFSKKKDGGWVEINKFSFATTFGDQKFCKIFSHDDCDRSITLSCKIEKEEDGIQALQNAACDWVESRSMTHRGTAAGHRLIDVFRDEIAREFQTPSVWRHFATSSHGLSLSNWEVESVGASSQGENVEKRVRILQLWKDRRGGDDSVLITRIRKAVEEFREHLNTL